MSARDSSEVDGVYSGMRTRNSIAPWKWHHDSLRNQALVSDPTEGAHLGVQ
jgi:hypothetical protein